MTTTIGAMALGCISLMLFLAAALTCWRAQMFDRIEWPMPWPAIVATYTVIWVIPSLTLWAIWATWFHCGSA